MVALFVLVSGLLAVVAVAAAGRPLGGRWGTAASPRPHGKAHCTQVEGNFNPITGVQIPLYHCTYGPPKTPKQARAGQGPCPALEGYCGDYEGGGLGPLLRGPISGRVFGPGRPRQASGSPGGLWLLLAAGSLFGVVLLTVGARRLSQRHRSTAADDLPPHRANSAAAGESPAADEGALLAGAADASLAKLRIEGDARRAIIGCYAQMERSLARAGMARRPSEAPLEYLARVLASVAPVAGQALTDLYERAMFSAKPMSDRDKDRAIDALEAVRHAALA